MHKIEAIVQARLGSSRLPLKSLLSLREKPVIDWVIDRLLRSRALNGNITVALPDTKLDQILAEHLRKRKIKFTLGPENDVLGRFMEAASQTKPDLIIRVCADNPLIWWDAIDQLVEFYNNGKYDYAYNHIPRGNLWPDGLGAEIISFNLLKELDKSAKLPSQREHCLNYIWDNKDQYKIGTFDPEDPLLQRPDVKLDLDTVQDFQNLALLPINTQMNAAEIIAIYDTKGKNNAQHTHDQSEVQH